MIKIFLIGFMGSGKSYVGERLARAMNLPFYDLDEYIEQKEGRSIARIFDKEGEAYFRHVERKCLRDFEHVKDAVIACGGGTPCYFDNLEWMNRQGISIYLQTPVPLLFSRLEKETGKRPLIADKSNEALAAYIVEKVNERSEVYKKASIIYHCRDEDEDIVGELLSHLSHLEKGGDKT